MPRTFICHHCGKNFPCNPRIKKQKYCSSTTCQNARRNFTNKAKSKKSDQSRRLRQLRNKRWRDAYPAHEYQKQYRKEHPEYVTHNRQKQKKHNKKRQKDVPSMIVKTYALSPRPMPDGVYMGFEVKNEKIVKTYAYMPVMQKQQGTAAYFPRKPG
jgi:hypothetical protein